MKLFKDADYVVALVFIALVLEGLIALAYYLFGAF